MSTRFVIVSMVTAIAAMSASRAGAVTVVNGDFNAQTANGGSSPFDGELDARGYAQFTDYNGDAHVLQENGLLPADGASGALAPGARLINVPGWAGDGQATGVADYLPSEVDGSDTHDDYGWVAPNGGFLFQNIGTSVAGSRYTLNFEIAAAVPNVTENWAVQIFEGIDPPGPGPGPSGAPGPGNGSTSGVVLAAASGFITGPATGPSAFVPMTTGLSDPAAGGLPLQIRLINFAGGAQLLYDNVSVVETVIPEPSSVALLGLGGLLMALAARRASRRARGVVEAG